ncbi:NAD(P)-dependent dehydrogenase (short-subunit alcohol dehydrogenase family) [Chryseobacterium vietnamense]|nr:NAD(P)-dependent dehydrogenase (short-subunit alcohol dehydrogenase family) [Chryseobacterium vietnamense]
MYVGSRDLQKGEAAVEQLGGSSKAIQLDITDSGSIHSAVEIVEKEYGYLTLLVNNAAISHAGTPGRTLEEIMGAQRASIAPVSELRKVWDTNVFGTLALTQAFLPLLHKAPSARIVTVSSALGSLTINANPQNPYRSNFDAVYGASKTALNGIFLSLAIDLENTGIKVHLVSPGFTATALNNFQGTDSVEEGSKEPIRVALAEDLPTGSFTGPADFSGEDNILPW